MDSQTVTLTLPFTAQQFWVFTIALSLIALSAGIVYVAGKRVEKERLPKDWLRDSLMIAGGLLAPIWAALLFMVLSALWHLAWEMPDVIKGANDTDNTDLRWHTISIVGAVTAIAAILGAPLAMIRLAMTERQTRATEEGLITDRINKAVEGLGAVQEIKKNDMTSTEPNLEVRVGALYALERLTHDSGRDRNTILNILIAYLANNSHKTTHLKEVPNDNANIQHLIINRLRTDIKVVLDIVEGVSSEKIDLSHLTFYHCGLGGRNFSNRQLNYSIFEQCNLQGAAFDNSTLESVDFRTSILSHTSFKNAHLIATKFNDKLLYWNDFSGAHFEIEFINGLKKDQGAKLSGAALSYLSIPFGNFILENLESVFGDASVTLPNGIDPDHDDWPSHWSKKTLSEDDFTTQWRAWQRSIGFQPDENQQ